MIAPCSGPGWGGHIGGSPEGKSTRRRLVPVSFLPGNLLVWVSGSPHIKQTQHCLPMSQGRRAQWAG